ncbi:MAG TPA: hypothetical protein VMV23_03625 [Candidatus Nanopelagicaceae bacterium]|nr:hypothetical protein [Candidatus Nanopelagicaceae bacterium]
MAISMGFTGAGLELQARQADLTARLPEVDRMAPLIECGRGASARASWSFPPLTLRPQP